MFEAELEPEPVPTPTVPPDDGRPAMTRRHFLPSVAGIFVLILNLVRFFPTETAREWWYSRPIPSVDIALVDGSHPGVRITNRSDRALEAYRFQIKIDGRVVESGWRDDCCFGATSRHWPLPPHSSVEVQVEPIIGGVSVTGPAARLSLVVFDDGSFEGRRDQYEALVKQREFVADDAKYWISAIDGAKDIAFAARHNVFQGIYEDRIHQAKLGRETDVALGIPNLVFAAGTNPEAYESVAADTKANLAAIESALRLRIAAASSR